MRPRRHRLRAARRAHRPAADRAARCGAAAGRPGSAAPEHRHVRDLPELLGDGDLLVVNDSKVIPARLAAARASPVARPRCCCSKRSTPSGAPGRRWCARRASCASARCCSTATGRWSRSAGAPRPATRSPSPCSATTIRWPRSTRHGRMPLPPYITAPLAEPDRYQTVYAAEPGSAAAPTAGLHLTPERARPRSPRGASTIARVELLVGLDTFKPVSVDDPLPARHPQRALPRAARRARAGRRGARVVAVGTTSVRALESAAATGQLSGRTRLFIHRPYDWQLVDLMMTNFHLPRTTLLLMIDAFVGQRWRRPLRRPRSPTTTASSASATRCSSIGRPPDAPRALRDGRHRRRSPRRHRHHRPRARTARRASCRSAPAARSSTSAPPTTPTSARRSCSATRTT